MLGLGLGANPCPSERQRPLGQNQRRAMRDLWPLLALRMLHKEGGHRRGEKRREAGVSSLPSPSLCSPPLPSPP